METSATPQRIPGSFERALTVFVMVVFTGAVIGVLDGHRNETGRGFDPSLLLKLCLGIAYGFAFYVTARDRAYVPRAGRKDIWISLLLLLAVCSTFWSDLPMRTFGRAMQLILTTWFAAYIARSFTISEQLELLQRALLFVVIASLLAGLLFPDYGIMHGGEFEGAWRGAFVHKNYLGRICVLGVLAFMTAWRALPDSRRHSGIGIFLSSLLLLLSTSRTALVSIMLVVALVPMFRSMRKRGAGLAIYLTMALVLVGSAGVWVNTHLDDVMQLLGRNLTLSGRTALWFAVLSFISRRPWLGYGYSAFWQGMEGNSGYISIALKWEVPHAHNGLLDLALDAGIVGVVLFLLSFAGTIRHAIAYLRNGPERTAFWPVLVLTFVVLSNTAESSLIRYGNLFWVLYVVTALSGSTSPVARTTLAGAST